MYALGLTGGIGSGKSTAARMFQALGARVFDADLEARRIMHEYDQVRAELVSAFGAAVYQPNGELDRRYLASRVFGKEAEIKRLNAIVHPRVHEAFRRARAEAESSRVPMLIHEAALIYESGGEHLVDGVVVVDAPEDLRIARSMQRDGSSREQVVARMRHQLPAEVLRERADFLLDNSGSEKNLERQVEALYRRLTTTRTG